MNQENSQQTSQVIDKIPNFVSYADMLKKPKEIQPESHVQKDPEKFVKLTKKSSN